MNNLPKVVAQQRRSRASNPRLLDRKSDALPLSHRAVFGAGSATLSTHVGYCQPVLTMPINRGTARLN